MAFSSDPGTTSSNSSFVRNGGAIDAGLGIFFVDSFYSLMPKSKTKVDVPQNVAEDASMDDASTSHQARSQDEAAATVDGPEAVEDADDAMEEEEEEEEQRVRILPGSTPTAASFEFINEGHTLGNALRYMIMKNPDVEFCAYAVPHPSEPKMNVRIQTYDESTTAIVALEKGLQDVQELCDIVAAKFVKAKVNFEDQMKS
ncbi:hypothetical protein P8C59_003832 [Phyllachora maydis]|uniref:DNA-directed RNA polymerase RBP11-like dimerisation domain-containing protein n=1 Tax=Phyllachora maydis TaxID=1825666 RepID=A0AAD9I287_9PEZI|nr:hypothetical protein P8C59_003832 [Phyllachora maydis]